MKSERRHELQHNDLAEWIMKSYEGVAPYKNAILGVGLLVVVLAVGLSLWHSHNLVQAGEAWSSLGVPVFRPIFADGQTIVDMDRTVQTYPREPAAEWAAVFAGDTFLMMGTNRIMTNKVGAEYQTEKKAAIDLLKQARDRYTKALDLTIPGALTIPAAREQAMFGKARAIESLVQSETKPEEAIAAYKELNDSFPNGMFRVIAEQRIEQLKKPDALKFYTALAQYAPKPKAESPRSPLGNLNLPDEPLEPTAPVRPDAPKTETPKTEPAKPQATKPDASKAEAPKTETPKTEPAKPQATKPDASKPEAPKTETPKTEPAKPEATKPDVSKPEAAKTAAPKTDIPKKDK